MKKKIITIGAVAIALLLVSTVSAVPQTGSETVFNILERRQRTQSLQENVAELYEYFNSEEIEMGVSGPVQSVPYNLEEIVEDLDMEGFIEFFISDDFIDFMKSDIVVNFLTTDFVTDFCNIEEVQDYTSSDAFTELMNTDEAEYFIDEMLEVSDLWELGATVALLLGIIIGVVLWLPVGAVVLGLAGVFTINQIINML